MDPLPSLVEIVQLLVMLQEVTEKERASIKEKIAALQAKLLEMVSARASQTK